MRIYTGLYIGIILTREEYIHIFAKEINESIIKVLNKRDYFWVKDSKEKKKCLNKTNKFVSKMLKDPLHNLNLYLNINKILSSKNFNFIHETINEQLNNPHLIKHNFPSYLTKFNKTIDEETDLKFDMFWIWDIDGNSKRDDFHFMGYRYDADFKITVVSELGLPTDLILKFLNKRSKKLKDTDLKLSKDIIGIINKYLTVNMNKKKIEIIIHNHSD